MKIIPLRGCIKVALVDDEDYDKLMKFGGGNYIWGLTSGYASMQLCNGVVLMHNLICLTNPGQEVDHIDGNKLNNQKSNLRACTRSQNHANSRLQKNNKSGVKGVSFDSRHQKWHAHIKINGKQKNLGLFKDINDAAEAYRKAAVGAFGEFANPVNNLR